MNYQNSLDAKILVTRTRPKITETKRPNKPNPEYPQTNGAIFAARSCELATNNAATISESDTLFIVLSSS